MTATPSGAAELEHRLGPNGRFALRLPAGEVSIRAVDDEIARVKDLSGRPLKDVFHITTGDGVLELAAKNRFGLSYQNGSLTVGSSAAELVVELPRRTRLAVDAASTDVSVAGIAGPGRFRTASGDLILTDVGGDVEFEAVSADVRVEAIAAIDLVGKTISGDVLVRAPRLDKLEMTTTSGDVRVDADLAGKGPYAIRTISGDVTLVARGGLRVEAQSVTGEVSSSVQPARTESAPGRRTLVIGKASTALAFKSVSGDLEVVEARDAAMPMPSGSPETSAASAAPAPSMPAFAADAPEAMAEASPEVESARLEILRSLERGEIDVEAAMAQLAAVEEA